MQESEIRQERTFYLPLGAACLERPIQAGEAGEEYGAKDQPGNYSPNGRDDVGFQEIRGNL